jgi:hypothetical protein
MRVKEVIELPEFSEPEQTPIASKAQLHCIQSQPISMHKTQPEPEILSAEQQYQAVNLAKKTKRQKLLARIQQNQRFKAANDTNQADVEQAWLDATFYQPRNSTL